MKRTDWELEAENWVRWSRAPGHDSYWDYGPGFFEAIVPPAGARTLELGCGEGRVARDLLGRGHRVVGIDASPTMVRHAIDADAGPSYVIGDAADLPFRDESFDLVVAYNALMDFDDMPRAISEAYRVLGPGGRMGACVLHPLADAGKFRGRSPDAPFTISGSYLSGRVYRETFRRAGLSMTFSSSAYPLETYAAAFEDAGFLIERLREPAVGDEAIRRDPGERRWTRVPLFLFLRAVKPR